MENTGMSNTIMSFDETTPLGEWMAYWLENYVRPIAKPAGYQHYRDNVEKHILPHLGKIPLGELTPPGASAVFEPAGTQWKPP